MAPIDQRPKGLVARRRGTVAAGQQPEAVIQPGHYLLHPQQLHPRRGQFNRQGYAVQLPAALDYGRGVVFSEDEAGQGGRCSFDKETHGIVLPQVFGGRLFAP